MFESTIGALPARKQMAIAAIAISGLMVFTFANMVEQASASHRPISFTRNIDIPCLPYCNVGNQPQDREIVTPFHHIVLDFSFISHPRFR
jgi:hypothetical protein